MLDSYLPYIDTELRVDDALRQKANELVYQACDSESLDEEKYLARKGYESKVLGKPPGGDKDSFLAREMDRVAKENGPPRPVEDDSRHRKMERPKDDAKDLEAWHRSIRHNRLILERLENDAIDLELQVEFGPSAWKVYAQTLEGLVEKTEREITKAKQESVEINQDRKAAHIRAGQVIGKAKEKWMDHIHQGRLISETLKTSKRKQPADQETPGNNKRTKL